MLIGFLVNFAKHTLNLYRYRCICERTVGLANDFQRYRVLVSQRAVRLRIGDDVLNSTTLSANVTMNLSFDHVTKTIIAPEYLGDSFYATVYAVFALSIIAAVCLRGLVLMLVCGFNEFLCSD